MSCPAVLLVDGHIIGSSSAVFISVVMSHMEQPQAGCGRTDSTHDWYLEAELQAAHELDSVWVLGVTPKCAHLCS